MVCICFFGYLRSQIHPLRYCVPMDNNRPSLDLRHFGDICPDENGTSKRDFINWNQHKGICQGPVIVVFTKYDQFKIDIRIKLEDQNRDLAQLDDEVTRMFSEHYLASLRGSSLFVR